MHVPIRWLSEYVEIDLPVREVADRLTMAGLEVTAIRETGERWKNIVVGMVSQVEPHPNADRLRLVTVDIGDELFKVVCGAPNIATGQKIAYAKLGALLIDAHTGEPRKLKRAKIRGIVSAGMVCSELELGLSEEHEGILVLAADMPVGEPLEKLLGDTILEIDMKPNRADGLSVLGIARDVAALTGNNLREPAIVFDAEGAPIAGRVEIFIEDEKLCPRYTLAIIEGIAYGSSPEWMQKRLIGAGMRPISNVVDITNYVMLELGQPIHAFDYDKIVDRTIIVRRAVTGETLTTLDGKERSLEDSQLIIADRGGPIAIAGVMGGIATEVTEKTERILLEVANFDPVSIRRTAMALKVPSEASRRFAWGVAPELAPLASRRATEFLVKLARGTAAQGMIDAYPGKEDPISIQLPRQRVPQVLGIEPSDKVIIDSLKMLGFRVGSGPEAFTIDVPYWRRDVRMADDVVEEIARMVGYDAIPEQSLSGRVPTTVPDPLRDLRERARNILVSVGMQEVITYPLTSLAKLEQVMSVRSLNASPPLVVLNPLNVGEECLRTTLRGSILETIARNLKVVKGVLAIFETARVYLRSEDTLPVEEEHVVGAITGFSTNRWGTPAGEEIDFFYAKAYVKSLFDGMHVCASYEAEEAHGLQPGQTAALIVDGERVGTLGQVHPNTAKSFGIEQSVLIFEIVLDRLVSVTSALAQYHSFSRFPEVVEDLAVVVDEGISSYILQSDIEKHPLVVSVRLFDIYKGEPVPDGRKSLAFSVSYQAQDRTLTDKEVSRAREQIMRRLKNSANAELRR